MLLIPLRALIIPKMSFTPEELSILDGPTASPFVSLLARDLLFNLISHRRTRLWNLLGGHFNDFAKT
jgi:hypothetical protein